MATCDHMLILPMNKGGEVYLILAKNIGDRPFLSPSSCYQNTEGDCGSDFLIYPLFRLPSSSSGLGSLNHNTLRTGWYLQERKMFPLSFL